MNLAPQKKWTVWVGRVLSAVPVLMMLLSSSMKLMHTAQTVDMFSGKFGYPPSALTPIGLLELACAIVYVIPRTAVLGAVLVSCYFAAALATHVRIGDPSGVIPVLLGVFAWGGLYLRDERIRSLLPIRRDP